MPTAEQFGFDPQKLHRAKQVLENHIQKRTTPGAVGLVLRRKGVVAHWAVGKHTYDANATPVQTDTLYDLASVTKVVATTTLCMLFAHDNRLNLDAPVQKYIPTFKGDGKDRVIVRHLLAHCSGMPAHVHLYKQHKNRDTILNAACQLPLSCEPRTETAYSDMGFLLLGIILETIGNNRLDHLTKQYIFDPLKMHNTLYCPDPNLKHRIPPTEKGTNLREGLVHGEVHDENAAALGGIAPHAGLFSTAHDLALFLQSWLGNSIFPTNTRQQFITRANFVPNSSWALGWDTVSPGGSSTGHHFTEQSFGSLGFTGTSIWADPIRDLGVILLTNRVHPTRNNTQIKHLRPEFHDAISNALIS
ncbi:MAG: serine hydrolase [Candidatus Latescibacteria bacterium]|jgi:CubicO group peptidase (beta-lactamase class C family)|nr:serine hydrolase [Candidatus Latescibacterota bacterium]